MEMLRKVILFGKTGAGKSTVANALVTGTTDHTQFPVSDGLSGCTSAINKAKGRGWEVTDTVGLGESIAGTVDSCQAEEMLLNFLTDVRDTYSHIVFVKSAEERFDTMDEQVWKTFLQVFRGADDAFVILLTRCSQDWLDKNFEAFPLWARNLGKEKILVTNLPPFSTRPKTEERNKSIRAKEIPQLEANLAQLVDPGPDMYCEPVINTMDSRALQKESKSLLDYIMQVVSALSLSEFCQGLFENVDLGSILLRILGLG